MIKLKGILINMNIFIAITIFQFWFGNKEKK